MTALHWAHIGNRFILGIGRPFCSWSKNNPILSPSPYPQLSCYITPDKVGPISLLTLRADRVGLFS